MIQIGSRTNYIYKCLDKGDLGVRRIKETEKISNYYIDGKEVRIIMAY